MKCDLTEIQTLRFVKEKFVWQKSNYVYKFVYEPCMANLNFWQAYNSLRFIKGKVKFAYEPSGPSGRSLFRFL